MYFFALRTARFLACSDAVDDEYAAVQSVCSCIILCACMPARISTDCLYSLQARLFRGKGMQLILGHLPTCEPVWLWR